jgi:hypothetical protein
VNDTSPEFDAVVEEHYRRMTPEKRMRIASSMYNTARAIVLASLPAGISRRDERLEIARRMYGGELPLAALVAHAEWEAD